MIGLGSDKKRKNRKRWNRRRRREREMTGTVSRKMDGAERPIHCVLPLTNNKNQGSIQKKIYKHDKFAKIYL